MDALTGQRIAGCVLEKHLGSGAIGTVYRARHEETDQLVAIKIVHSQVGKRPDFLQRLHREARLCYQLDHPHIVRVHTWGESNGYHYVVMDYIDGKTLFQVIRHHGHLRWPVAVGLLVHVAGALVHVHELGIIHRDLKPDNILVGRDGLARLADLGLARQLADAADEIGGRRLTDEGMAMGSPCYMAPEQIKDTSKVGPAADIYALGTTLFHALTGRPPLMGEDARETLKVVLEQTPRRASAFIGDIPRPISDLIEACLAKNPADRPQDVKTVKSLLHEVLDRHKQSSAADSKL